MDRIPPRPIPPAFALREVLLPPGGELAFRAADWAGAFVVVEQGELELECRRGGHRSFAAGSLLWLDGLPLRTLRNRGGEEVRLSAISRRPAGDEFSIETESESP